MRYCLTVLLRPLFWGGSSRSYHIETMPVPALYAISAMDPFRRSDPFASIRYQGMLFATDREPQNSFSNPSYQRYKSNGGFALRLGRAEVEIGDGALSWQEVKVQTLKAEHSHELFLRLNSSVEFGILPNRVAPLVASAFSQIPDPTSQFVFSRQSEISSDILATLLYNLRPEERGLVRTTDNPVWSVPKDYISTLRSAVIARESLQTQRQ